MMMEEPSEILGCNGSKSKVRTKKTILFVCVENAGRSQMAEGFFWKYAPETDH
jgi:hypothetical protein